MKAHSIDGQLKRKIQEKIDIIEEKIGQETINENYKSILETTKNLDDGQDLNVLERQKLWKMLKHKFPKNLNGVPAAKKDKDGNIITEHKELKHLYLKTYAQRLRNRPIKQNLEHIKRLKEVYFMGLMAKKVPKFVESILV